MKSIFSLYVCLCFFTLQGFEEVEFLFDKFSQGTPRDIILYCKGLAYGLIVSDCEEFSLGNEKCSLSIHPAVFGLPQFFSGKLASKKQLIQGLLRACLYSDMGNQNYWLSILELAEQQNWDELKYKLFDFSLFKCRW